MKPSVMSITEVHNSDVWGGGKAICSHNAFITGLLLILTLQKFNYLQNTKPTKLKSYWFQFRYIPAIVTFSLNHTSARSAKRHSTTGLPPNPHTHPEIRPCVCPTRLLTTAREVSVPEMPRQRLFIGKAHVSTEHRRQYCYPLSRMSHCRLPFNRFSTTLNYPQSACA